MARIAPSLMVAALATLVRAEREIKESARTNEARLKAPAPPSWHGSLRPPPGHCRDGGRAEIEPHPSNCGG